MAQTFRAEHPRSVDHQHLGLALIVPVHLPQDVADVRLRGIAWNILPVRGPVYRVLHGTVECVGGREWCFHSHLLRRHSVRHVYGCS